MTTPNIRVTPPIHLLVFAFALTLVVTTSIHADDQVWTPCGRRGGTSLPMATHGVSMNHCFLNRSTIQAFNDITTDEYTNGTHAVINPIQTDERYRRENESRVTFLCRGLVLMKSFIDELDYVDENALGFDVTTAKQRFVAARDSLNTSLTTMITKCPLLTNAPLQLEEVDTNATVCFATERRSDSNWMMFLNIVKAEMQTLRVRRFIGTKAYYPDCNADAEILCTKGSIFDYDRVPVTGEDDWE